MQVYGWLFDDHGRVLVQDTPDGHNLPGGSPELVDADPAATLHREAAEESQVRRPTRCSSATSWPDRVGPATSVRPPVSLREFACRR
ncbi:NUDIX hydrolase [Micromonospora sp. WMMD723]|uniref:NUDIX hydrolase n=1 Tax=Micromonospora sp. WMMD723 TaxID=3403465 RepID=UPI003CF3688F